MKTGTPSKASRITGGDRAFIVWLDYQRRAEVLAPLLNSHLRFLPHKFQNKGLRPLDYVLKLIVTVFYFVRRRPPVVFLQVPPVFPAIAAILTNTPFVLDVHNGLVQNNWSRVPLTDALAQRAAALIAHNPEITQVIKARFPGSTVFTISDPIPVIGDGRQKRGNTFLFICSFGRDEPLDLILKTVKTLPQYTFFITGKPQKLSQHMRVALESCANVHLPGFLKKADYQALLCTSKAAVVLTTSVAVQPSGACEALASDTPLIVTKTALTRSLFGAWALLVDNTVESIVAAIRSVKEERLDLTSYRHNWNQDVERGIANLDRFLGETLRPVPSTTVSTTHT